MAMHVTATAAFCTTHGVPTTAAPVEHGTIMQEAQPPLS